MTRDGLRLSLVGVLLGGMLFVALVGMQQRAAPTRAGSAAATPTDQHATTAVPSPARAPDVVAPKLVRRTPSAGSTADTDTSVEVVFSEPVSGVDAASLTLRGPDDALLAAEVRYQPARRRAILTPGAPLLLDTRYRVSISGAVRDLGGNPLQPVAWSFRTNDRVRFRAGTYTGYAFTEAFDGYTEIRRATLAGRSGAPATRYQEVDGQGFVLIGAGLWEGLWVHATPDGRAQRDAAAPVTPLPACAYADLPTPRTDPSDWATVVLDALYRLPASYVPPDLVDTSAAGLNTGYFVRRVALADLAELNAAARADGIRLAVYSAYRSYVGQQLTFNAWIRRAGLSRALQTSARPGHSEHQLGTTIDFREMGGPIASTYRDWTVTPAGAWLRDNAWRFGWVMSYPAERTAATCYAYEPWHYRYLGRDLAAAIHASGLTPREWLWAEGYGIR